MGYFNQIQNHIRKNRDTGMKSEKISFANLPTFEGNTLEDFIGEMHWELNDGMCYDIAAKEWLETWNHDQGTFDPFDHIKFIDAPPTFGDAVVNLIVPLASTVTGMEVDVPIAFVTLHDELAVFVDCKRVAILNAKELQALQPKHLGRQGKPLSRMQQIHFVNALNREAMSMYKKLIGKFS